MNYSQPLSYYTQAADKPLLFHVLDVGEGLMILAVFPDETTMLYDCNVTEGNKDAVLDYLSANLPFRRNPENETNAQWIDIFVNSHRDIDHYRGLKSVNDSFEIKSIWDSGQAGETTNDTDYQYYMRLRRNLINKFGDDAVRVQRIGRQALNTVIIKRWLTVGSKCSKNLLSGKILKLASKENTMTKKRTQFGL